MPGGVQLTQQQRKQQIITGLHKTAEKSGSLKVSTEQLAVDSKQYGKSMSRTKRFMSILGIGKLFHHQQDESAETIGQQVEEQTEISQDAEKELSYQKKTSKQEEAAQRRGEFTGSVYTGQKAAAQAALGRYMTDQAHGNLDVMDVTDGNEFADMKDPQLDQGDIEERIYNILRARDQLRADVERLQEEKNPAAALYVKQLKEKLECTEDALNTMYLANGLSLDGKTVSDKQISKAKEHLPLALEKYEYMHRNHDRLVGQSMMKMLKKTNEWAAEKQRLSQEDQSSSQQADRVTGIPADQADAYDELQDLISSHPYEYMANKKQIDQAFSRFTQCLKKADEMDTDTTIANTLMGGIPGEIALAARVGFGDIERRNMKIRHLLTYQAESSKMLVEFLLTGKKVDVLHGEFIEKTWGIKAYDRDLNVPLNQSLDEFKGVSDAYADRVKAVKQAISSESDPVRLAILQKADKRLAGEKDRGCAYKADALAYADEDAVEGAVLKEKAFGKPEYAPFRKEMGFKQMTDAMSPVTGKPAFDEARLLSYAHQLAIVKTGSDMDGNGASDEEKTQAFRSVLGLYLDQADELEKYIESNPDMFATRDAFNAMRDWAGLPKFEKKAFGTVKGMEILIESPLFNELNDSDKKEFVDTYDHLHRMAMCSGELVSGISQYESDSTEEYAKQPMHYRILYRADFNGSGATFRDSKAEAYRKPSFKREFKAVSPARAQ